ncbi:MAG: TIGR01458 family HAD-type hydrolase [Candidatus Altarchaeaceae archaeon]
MAYLIDINGVLYSGNKVIDGAIEKIDELRKNRIKFCFVSNATQRCKESLVEKLRKFGFEIYKEEIFTPSEAAVIYIKGTRKFKKIIKERKVKIFLLTKGDVYKDFYEFEIVDKDSDFVIVGDAGENFNFENMNKAFREILNNKEFIALEKDRYWMDDNNELSLCAGAFVKGLEYSTGKRAIVVGKPSKKFFEFALKSINAKKEETYIIGDDIYTDILGGKKAGLKTILVKTGKFKEEIFRNSKIKPDVIINSIKELKIE